MNKPLTRALLGLSVVLAAVLVAATTIMIIRGSTSVSHRAQAELEQPGEDEDEGEAGEEEEEEDPAGGDAWFAGQRIFPFQSLDIGSSLRNARGQARALAAKQQGLAAGPAWQLLGPSNIGGRITDIVDHPTQANTIFVGAATGGVWKSTDSGATFTLAWNPADPPSIGALAITAGGVLYAGTGESNPGGGSVTFPGNGIYRSTDSGASWTNLGLTGTERIGRIAIDPTNTNRLFVAAAGSLFVPGGSRGLYRTTDGGTNWQLVLAGTTTTTGAIDVAIDPSNPNRVYAAMWDHQRFANGRVFGGVGSGIYRSTDGGTTWTRLGGGLPASNSNLGRMSIAVAANSPSRVYAMAVDTSGDFTGFWTSTNSGDSWTQITNTSALSSSQSTYGWWFGRIWVDPAASTHLFVAGVPMVESTNAGSTWTSNSSSFHADQHAMAWDPGSSGRVYLGNDGGVYRSQSNGSLGGSWTKGTYQPFNQFYTVAVSRQDFTRVLGGAQDNGSLRSWGTPSWNSINGGDGTTSLISPTNQNNVYVCSQNGSCRRSTNGGSSTLAFGSTTSSRRNWVTPVVFDPNNAGIIYYAGDRVNRSTNLAQSFTVISPDLTHGAGGIGGYVFGTVTTLAVAKSAAATIYAGTDDGRVWRTTNTGGSWTEITAGLPTRWITRVAVDPANSNLAYVTVSGFRNGDPAAHVFKTTNGGSTWTDISGDLPDAPVNDIVLDPITPSTLYVGTDVGVFSTTNGGTNWSVVGSSLPLVPISDLDVAQSGTSRIVTAATYGLGMYRVTL